MFIKQKTTIYGITLSVLFLAGVALWAMGRTPICTCGYVKIWEGNNWGAGNSQHLTDWYTFSHIIHGFIFYYLLRRFLPKLSPQMHVFLALIVESAWEILENSPTVINRYRTTTSSIDYYGDSVVNSLADILSMLAGFLLAKRLTWKTILFLAIAMELLTAYMIRDGLFFNIVMLIYPLQFIRDWQIQIAPKM